MSNTNLNTDFDDAGKSPSKNNDFIKKYPISGEPGILEWMPLSMLIIDVEYQRELRDWHIRDIAKKWDWSAVKPLNVAKRGKYYFVVDGQHLLQAAKLRGDIKKLPTYIVVTETQVSEAIAFDLVNTNRIGMSAQDKHIARCVAGDEFALHIKAIYEKHGLVILRLGQSKNTRRNPKHFACISAFYTIERSLSEIGGLDYVLRIIRLSWPMSVATLSAHFVKGLATLLFAVSDSIGEDALIRRFRKLDPESIVDDARTEWNATKGMALVKMTALKIAAHYDRGLQKNRISEYLILREKNLSPRIGVSSAKQRGHTSG